MKILMYHLIDDIDSPMAVPPSRFAEQMALLAGEGYRLITGSELHDALLNRQPLPHNAVLVTFDDGYTNTFTTALPVLEHYGVPAVMAVCGGYLTDDLPLHLPHTSQEIAETAAVAAWLESGREIAAHSYTHPRLTTLTDTALHWQIHGDAETLTELLGVTPRIFAYPYGAHDARVRAAVAQVYPLAMATGEHQATGLDPHRLPRIQVDPRWDLRQFRTALHDNPVVASERRTSPTPTSESR
ncbi:polysaccharide deacetylase family protein [Nocardia xishanensis]|uniref:Polysaccharide deacetylase family protein n=1 Tax=Nocardia xishanensis TaxID=238964 RepID=A0ABW7WW93_9NOCA